MINRTLIILFSSLILSIFSLNSIASNIFAQTTNGTMNMNINSSGGGMQGMGGMQGARGEIKEIYNKVEDIRLIIVSHPTIS